MNVLIVASGNSNDISPFIKEQVDSLINLDVKIQYFLIKGNGSIGYLQNIVKLRNVIKKNTFDLIHAHYGLSGLLATFQRLVPVIITFHGSDINLNKNYILSFLASRLSAKNVFVHPDQPEKLKIKVKKQTIIPCGIDLNIFYPRNKKIAKQKIGWHEEEIYILFSSAFDNPIKNIQLARKSIENIKNVNLIELKNFTKNELSNLMNASDLLLITSFSETGPLVAKEALACNCPVVSTDVGDVKKMISLSNNSYITTFNPNKINKTIIKVLKQKDQVKPKLKDFNKYSLTHTAIEIKKVYEKCIQKIN